ncbi:MAG: sensor histidine kinase [Dehalococcoidia bacterium]|nr:sensor histidine kinase [Dehalococcoidia bacterium]
MNYNDDMNETTPRLTAVRLIRFASVLWLAYLVALAFISQTFREPSWVNLIYYALLSVIALLCLGLSFWSWIQEKLRQAFVPLVIVIITVMPVLVNYFMGRLSPFGPRFTMPEVSVLAMFPFLFVALLLVAWQYKWQYMLLVILGFTALNVGISWSSARPGSPPFQGGMIISLIQTVIFLVVGFSISYLMSRLRRQQQSLEEANLRLTHYASTLDHLATSRERNRVARELHDTLAHTLSGLAVQLQAVKAYWEVDTLAAHSMLDKSLLAAHSGLEETRRALKALRASPLDELGLIPALRELFREAAARANLELELDIMENMPALSPDVEQCVYRIAQESVTNVINHAHARHLSVRLKSSDGKVTLQLRDDGAGFDVDKARKSGHYGLAGMQERAELVGAEFDISSKEGSGTSISLAV